MSLMNDEMRRALEAPLPAEMVAQRDAGGGRQVSYLEGYQFIAQANKLFGFDGWSYRVLDVSASTTTEGRIFYRAIVEVEALGVKRTDVGVAIVEVRRNAEFEQPDAHDMALKGAVTDAMKRGLRSFGAQFGNELYDKASTRTNRRQAPPAQPPARSDGVALPTSKEIGERMRQMNLSVGDVAGFYGIGAQGETVVVHLHGLIRAGSNLEAELKRVALDRTARLEAAKRAPKPAQSQEETVDDVERRIIEEHAADSVPSR